MADLITIITTNLLIVIIALIISALPLYFAVKILGGEASVLKVIFINIISAAIPLLLSIFVGAFAGLASFILVIVIYRIAFDISFIKAIFAWVLQYIIAIALVYLVIATGLIGIALFK